MDQFDNKRASDIHGQALDAWESGDLDRAYSFMREAIALSEPGHSNLEQYYASLGGVLSRMGRKVEAGAAFESALAEARAQASVHYDDPEASNSVVVARYFLAEHLLERGQAAEALATITPSLGRDAQLEGILQYIRAHALKHLNRLEESKEAAQRAVELATSEDQP